MFEHLPVITEGSYQVFIDRELLEVMNTINDCMDELRERNHYLARAIGAGAVTAAEGFDAETAEVVKADVVGAQLAVLRLIARELEARQLEIQLLNGSKRR